jgi:putative peptidoglycan lipid II flippase
MGLSVNQCRSHDPGGGEDRAMVRAAGEIGFYTLLSRVTGLLRDIVIGALFGAGFAADAFFVAFRIPNLLRRLVGEGAATVAFIPVVTDYLTHRSRADTEEMIRAAIGAGIAVLLTLTIAGVVWAEPLVRLFAPGFTGAKLDLTVTLNRIMFFYLFCIGLVALAMGILHPLRHFAAPAFSPVLLNVAIIVCALGLSRHLTQPILSVAYGVVIGGLCQLFWQIPVLVRLGVPLWPRWQPRHPALRRIAVMLGPMVFGSAVYHLSLLVNTILASLLAEGSVSSLWYASRLFEFPLGVFVTAFGTAALPSFAAQVQRQDLSGMCESLGVALRLVNFIALPAAVGLAVLAVPISAVLFFRGAFTAEQVRATATVLQWLSLGLWAVAATRLLTSCLYAMEDTRTPVYAGIVAFVANVCFSLMFMGKVTVSVDSQGLAGFFAALSGLFSITELGAGGLALAASLSAIVHLGFLGIVLYRRLGTFPWSAWNASFGWSLLGAAVMVVPVQWIASQIYWLDPQTPFAVRVGVLALAVTVGAVSYGFVVWWKGKAEFHALAEMLPERALRFLPQFLQPLR